MKEKRGGGGGGGGDTSHKGKWEDHSTTLNCTLAVLMELGDVLPRRQRTCRSLSN